MKTRRPEGSIRRRADGRYEVRVQTGINYSTGAPIRKSVYAHTEEEAQRLLTDKSYLESVYRAGAERAAKVAGRTLRKVYKKVGFVAP